MLSNDITSEPQHITTSKRIVGSIRKLSTIVDGVANIPRLAGMGADLRWSLDRLLNRGRDLGNARCTAADLYPQLQGADAAVKRLVAAGCTEAATQIADTLAYLRRTVDTLAKEQA